MLGNTTEKVYKRIHVQFEFILLTELSNYIHIWTYLYLNNHKYAKRGDTD